MFCNECGTQLPDGSKFCNNCGYQINATIVKNEETNISNETDLNLDLETVYNIYGKNKIGFSSYLVSQYHLSLSEAKKITDSFLETKKDEKAPNIFKRAKFQAENMNAFPTSNVETKNEMSSQNLIKICPNCGDTLISGAVFCPSCKFRSKNLELISKDDIQKINELKNQAKNPHFIGNPLWMNEKPISKKQQAKERIKDNKQNGVACCPKCGSTSISANKKGFGIGKAIIGAGITNAGIGLIAGNIGAKKVQVTCLNCKNRWTI